LITLLKQLYKTSASVSIFQVLVKLGLKVRAKIWCDNTQGSFLLRLEKPSGFSGSHKKGSISGRDLLKLFEPLRECRLIKSNH